MRSSRNVATAASQRVVSSCLIGCAVTLLLVGVVSGTLLRHAVQIAPIMLAWGLVTQRPHWGVNAATPVFIFWIFIMVLIWLFLLGLSKIASGHYTVVDIVSTLFVAGFCLPGVVTSVPLGKALKPTRRTVAVALFAVLQISAMWISFSRPIANR